jgi:hypothetical protein
MLSWSSQPSSCVRSGGRGNIHCEHLCLYGEPSAERRRDLQRAWLVLGAFVTDTTGPENIVAVTAALEPDGPPIPLTPFESGPPFGRVYVIAPVYAAKPECGASGRRTTERDGRDGHACARHAALTPFAQNVQFTGKFADADGDVESRSCSITTRSRFGRRAGDPVPRSADYGTRRRVLRQRSACDPRASRCRPEF